MRADKWEGPEVLLKTSGKRVIIALLAIGGFLGAESREAADLARYLRSLPAYAADARFEVFLPSAENPVIYDISLESVAANDSLSPCNYIIDWTTETSAGPMRGFSAYYDGNHYRFRNNRLQEYHVEGGDGAFRPLGRGSERQGVQYTAQFADMLPQFVGDRIEQMLSDSSYIFTYHSDTLVNRRRSEVVEGVKRGDGYDAQCYTYVFDYDTHLPVLTEIESSPGSISEQIITLTYNTPSKSQVGDINEAVLVDRWPEVFEKYRESTFKAENLVGAPLPAFASQVLDGSERFHHHADEVFDKPVIIVMLDQDVATTAETIEAVRQAVDMAPMDVDVLWAFGSNDADGVRKAVGSLRRGETALVSAKSLVRNCGITMYPTIILVGRDAKVNDVLPGFNKDLGMVVLQKTMLMK